MTAIRHLILFGIPTALMLAACPEDGDGEQGAAGGGPGGGPGGAGGGGGGGIADGTLGAGQGNAHDCGGSYRVAQESITDGVPLSGTITCGECTGQVMVTVLDLPPTEGGSEGDPCITSATFDGPGDFTMNLPAGLSAVNIVTMDMASSGWGLKEKVPVSGAGATGVSLIVGDKPEGTPITSAGEELPSERSGEQTNAAAPEAIGDVPQEEVSSEAPETQVDVPVEAQ